MSKIKIALRYPEIKDAERYFEILTNGIFEHYYATLPSSIEDEITWIKRRKLKRDKNIEYNYSILYDHKLVGGVIS